MLYEQNFYSAVVKWHVNLTREIVCNRSGSFQKISVCINNQRVIILENGMINGSVLDAM